MKPLMKFKTRITFYAVWLDVHSKVNQLVEQGVSYLCLKMWSHSVGATDRQIIVLVLMWRALNTMPQSEMVSSSLYMTLLLARAPWFLPKVVHYLGNMVPLWLLQINETTNLNKNTFLLTRRGTCRAKDSVDILQTTRGVALFLHRTM